MIKISSIVYKIIEKDEVALFALSEGWLNLSAYSQSIKNKVEEGAKKTVKLGSIVVALYRLTLSLKKQSKLIPSIVLENISAKSGLIEIAFNKSLINQKLINQLYSNPHFAQNNFYTLTQGVNEISVIAAQSLEKFILNLFKHEKPKFQLRNLAALTVSFGSDYIFTPNTTFALVRVLAIHRINIVEVVSTFTELTFLLTEQDLQQAFALMGELMKNKI